MPIGMKKCARPAEWPHLAGVGFKRDGDDGGGDDGDAWRRMPGRQTPSEAGQQRGSFSCHECSTATLRAVAHSAVRIKRITGAGKSPKAGPLLSLSPASAAKHLQSKTCLRRGETPCSCSFSAPAQSPQGFPAAAANASFNAGSKTGRKSGNAGWVICPASANSDAPSRT